MPGQDPQQNIITDCSLRDPLGILAESPPSVSVVIPTHNRKDKLYRLLKSLEERPEFKGCPIIVVDDSESPPELGSAFPTLDIRHLVSPRRIFISKAKNLGWQNANTDLIYFIDDDNVVEETTFQPLFQKIASSPSIGALMPGVVYASNPELVWVYATPFLNSRLVLNLVGRNAPRNPLLEGRLLLTDALPNASLVRVKALRQVGGFDERLVVNSSLDFAQRLKGSGWGVYAHTSGIIRHDVELPGKLGWWATHGSADPARVRFELRDWFLISKRLHPQTSLFRPRFALMSLRFVGPNTAGYMARSKERTRLLRSLLTGYVEGFELTGHREYGYGAKAQKPAT